MKELKQYIDRVLGNNIRCLLPSYWWKRLFGLVIDEVDGKASKESVATLEKKIENFKGGGVQAITIYPLDRSTKQNYHRQVYDTLVELDAKEEDFIVYAEVGIGGIFPATMIVANSLSDTLHYVFDFRGWEQTENHGYTKTEKEHYTVALFADGTMQLDTTQDYVIDHVISETSTNAVQNKAVAEALGGYVLFPLMNAKEFITSYYNDEKPRARGLVYAVSSDIGDNISEVISLKYGNKQYAIYFVANGSVWRGIYDGTTYDYIREEKVSSERDLETRSFKSTNSDSDKEWNKETISLFLEGKVSIVYPYPIPNGELPEGTDIDLMPNTHIFQNGTHQFWFTVQHPFGGYTNYGIAIQSDGTYDDDVEEFKPDTEMSDTSTNVVQNKVIKAYVDNALSNVQPEVNLDSELSETSENAVQNKVITTALSTKVDKIEGKQLSTEDFTSTLKTKLEGLNNYDDTELSEAIETLRSDFDTLVSGDSTTAIKTFNEIISFLDGIEDSESLDSIIASIEQQVANKQNKIEDIETIRSGAALGATSLQEHQDISHLATKEEVENLENEVITDEEIYAAALTDLNSRLINVNESISTEITTREALSEEFQTFKTSVTENEEVWATSLTDINDRITANYNYGETTYSTKTEHQTEIEAINTTLVENEEVIAATLNDLNSQIAALNAIIAELTTRIETLENA